MAQGSSRYPVPVYAKLRYVGGRYVTRLEGRADPRCRVPTLSPGPGGPTALDSTRSMGFLPRTHTLAWAHLVSVSCTLAGDQGARTAIVKARVQVGYKTYG